jgi:phosphatidylserine/phosphatidylglycerophosphate/cardiolipin synthase-like enzyme
MIRGRFLAIIPFAPAFMPKCIVIDDGIALTSGNFTEWTQERNLEACVLIRDESFARSPRNQFESLIAASRLHLLPGSAI